VSQLQTHSHVQLHWQLSQPCAHTLHTSHMSCTRHAHVMHVMKSWVSFLSSPISPVSICSNKTHFVHEFIRGQDYHINQFIAHSRPHSVRIESVSVHSAPISPAKRSSTHTVHPSLGSNISENKAHCTGKNEQTTSENLGSTWILLLLCIAWEAYSTALCVYKLI
jgi:hypothetical protein